MRGHSNPAGHPTPLTTSNRDSIQTIYPYTFDSSIQLFSYTTALQSAYQASLRQLIDSIPATSAASATHPQPSSRRTPEVVSKRVTTQTKTKTIPIPSSTTTIMQRNGATLPTIPLRVSTGPTGMNAPLIHFSFGLPPTGPPPFHAPAPPPQPLSNGMYVDPAVGPFPGESPLYASTVSSMDSSGIRATATVAAEPNGIKPNTTCNGKIHNTTLNTIEAIMRQIELQQKQHGGHAVESAGRSIDPSRPLSLDETRQLCILSHEERALDREIDLFIREVKMVQQAEFTRQVEEHKQVERDRVNGILNGTRKRTARQTDNVDQEKRKSHIKKQKTHSSVPAASSAACSGVSSGPAGVNSSTIPPDLPPPPSLNSIIRHASSKQSQECAPSTPEQVAAALNRREREKMGLAAGINHTPSNSTHGAQSTQSHAPYHQHNGISAHTSSNPPRMHSPMPTQHRAKKAQSPSKCQMD